MGVEPIDEAVFIVIHRNDFLWIMGVIGVTGTGVVVQGFRHLWALVAHTKRSDYAHTTIANNAAAQTRAFRSFARLQYWQAEKLTGEKPPPLDLGPPLE